ncbi:D-TA family PLP-dependent enzyme [Nibrella viscosa]|uniref:D-TA family PLP-dependent enzyme n=1 Tax=Nibrella viscosa TaxID=1084524 RepID=A0ABP8KGC3_9BACT
MEENWYTVQHVEQIDSPALLVYPDRIARNIGTMIDMVGGHTERLIPHVKTHKMAEVVQMQLDAGIIKFKCATIAEAEMLATTGAQHVLLAYQLTGPKINRFRALVQAFPQIDWASLVDNYESADELGQAFSAINRKAVIYVDVNNGMNRTGHLVNGALGQLYHDLSQDDRFDIRGFHIYDGHFRDSDYETRKAKADEAFAQVRVVADKLERKGLLYPMMVVGGTPTFSVHAKRKDVWCSPGTCLFWDWGYADGLPDQHFNWAALLLTRIISKPAEGIVTTDLGHKAVAAENPLAKRVQFLNLAGYDVIGQSEEHLVLQVDNWETVRVGDVLYGVPYHICPTVALHDEAHVIEEGRRAGCWTIASRKRRLQY